jgi:hypothetical protein
LPDYRDIIRGIYFGGIALIVLIGLTLGMFLVKMINSCSEHPVDAAKADKPKKEKKEGEKRKKKTGEKTKKKKSEKEE